MNEYIDLKHGRNHFNTSHWGILLTSAREITSDKNDSQGTLVDSNECQWMIWNQTLMESFNQRPMM